MSMLAERRRKTKWVINPTKKPIWTTDSEGIKLGKQLMEKMGWSAGKGLGAKEQGIQEPLKVSYKNDTKGMGFKGNDEDWMEHQDEFNSLLSQLSSSDPSKPAEVDKNEIKSLEEKSKHSRARVHYQKFTRGKDLSRYSETDLACILGINHSKKRKNSLEEKTPVEEKTDGNYETSFGVTTINSGSILDYFKKKWTVGQSKENNSSKTVDEVTEHTSNNTEECAITTEHKKSKKHKHDELNSENLQVPDDQIIKTLGEVENPEVGEEIKKTKKSKKRKYDELVGDNLEVPENKTVEALEEVQNSEVGEEVKKNRKSKKQKLKESHGEDLEVPESEYPVEASEEVENLCSLEVGKDSKKHKKSKKKKREDIDIESESVSKEHKKEKYDADMSNQIEENNQEIVVSEAVENVNGDNDLGLDNKKCEEDENCTRKRKKDKKKHKIKESDVVEQNLEPVDHKIKKKKKKDKDHLTESEKKEVKGESYPDKHYSSLTENDHSKSVSEGNEKFPKLDLIEDNTMNNPVNLESDKSRKEKRRKEKHKSDQSKLENEEEISIKCNISAEEVESKSKKKKRKEKLGDESILENEEKREIKTGSLLEEVEPVIKEKKKKEKHKSEQTKLENETVTKSTTEETTKIKEKKKKDKHRSDGSVVENEEEEVTKSKDVHEGAEPKVKEKVSKKNKLGETKKSKHETDSEGVDKSNINSETVEGTKDVTNGIQKESEKLKKAEIDTKVKEDSEKLAKGNKPKEDGSKTEDGNRIHSHKFELFKKKKEISLLGQIPKNSRNNRVLGLIFGAEFEKFKGANIDNLVGYGMQNKIQGKDDG